MKGIQIACIISQDRLHINSTSSIAANHPRHTFVVPYFHLTGAGVRVNWSGLGSFPQDRQTVVAEGKDHIQADPSTITASIWVLAQLHKWLTNNLFK